MMDNKEINDKHTLYIYSGAATRSQIEKSLLRAIQDCSQLAGKSLKCDFYINVVCGVDKIPKGFSIIWLSNEIVYNLLSGKNIDGSSREYYIDDDEWKPPERNFDEVFDEFLQMDLSYMYWYEIVDLEEKIIKSYERPKKLVKQEPLIKLENYIMSEEQKKILEKQEKKDKYIGRENGALLAKAAKVTKKDPNYVPNVIMCINRPRIPTSHILESAQKNTTEKLSIKNDGPKVYLIFETEAGSSFFLLLRKFFNIDYKNKNYLLKFENVTYYHTDGMFRK